MVNKFNDLTSKQWLPFQKSFFLHKDFSKLYEENILFFTKKLNSDGDKSNILYKGNQEVCTKIKDIAKKLGRDSIEFSFVSAITQIDFAIFDERQNLDRIQTIEQYNTYRAKLYEDISSITRRIARRRFIMIIAQNIDIDGLYIPAAWDIGSMISNNLTLKDEKIACIESMTSGSKRAQGHFKTDDSTFYCLYFRHDEKSPTKENLPKMKFQLGKEYKPELGLFDLSFPSWQIVKSPPRNKTEILHPAKFPEPLIEKFIKHFTRLGENVFDPMSGTGSTQVAAIHTGRNAYGIELSQEYALIAQTRLQDAYEQSIAGQMAGKVRELKFEIKNMDARFVNKDYFPIVDYIITSPPYWNMLNMKGAANQAKRRKLGLATNYSDSSNDLGNIKDYDEFLRELTFLYKNLINLLRPGGFLTIIVKNIKKGGANYPFAWDLAANLSKYVIVCQESFWCQDDLRIAPYGYGNTFVSNTFHHYCLNFRKKY